MPTLHNVSSAYKLEYYYPKKDKEKVPGKRKNLKKVTTSINKGKVMLSIAISLAIAFTILWRYTMIIEANNQVKNLQDELSRLERITEQVKVELDSSIDLERIERIAREELGMRRPENYQIVYVDINTSDYAQVLGNTPKPNTTHNLLAIIFNRINKVLAYLY